jgi:hypothetical protein
MKPMTEREWLRTADFRRMIHLLEGKASPRKFQLFACASCRRVRWYDPDVIDLLEAYADRRAKRKDAMAAVKAAIPEGRINAYCSWLFWKASCLEGADIVAAINAGGAVTSNGIEETPENYRAEERVHADLLRCIIGNPFHPGRLDRSALTPAVTALAKSIYADQCYKDLPILADALEEAGCTNANILSHCRQPGEHVRGCWALDLVLGKS